MLDEQHCIFGLSGWLTGEGQCAAGITAPFVSLRGLPLCPKGRGAAFAIRERDASQVAPAFWVPSGVAAEYSSYGIQG